MLVALAIESTVLVGTIGAVIRKVTVLVVPEATLVRLPKSMLPAEVALAGAAYVAPLGRAPCCVGESVAPTGRVTVRTMKVAGPRPLLVNVAVNSPEGAPVGMEVGPLMVVVTSATQLAAACSSGVSPAVTLARIGGVEVVPGVEP